MAKIGSIEGIGPTFQQKLEAAGITTTEGLLEKGATDSSRATLAEAAGIPQKRIDTWVSMADLFRVKGVGRQFAELLVRSGIGSAAELAESDAASLRTTLQEHNAEKKMVKVIPSVDALNKFMAAARAL
ncbi:MAG: DUF4332 domain-containing protein [Saprospiraceae bacterium]